MGVHSQCGGTPSLLLFHFSMYDHSNCSFSFLLLWSERGVKEHIKNESSIAFVYPMQINNPVKKRILCLAWCLTVEGVTHGPGCSAAPAGSLGWLRGS